MEQRTSFEHGLPPNSILIVVRMVCASFLVEYLRVSWVDGAEWFADTLCDADPAINAMMWQNAGRSGIDQWNFVMSPENASQDPSGKYTRRYVPELANLPNKHLHRPWLAPKDILTRAGVRLGASGYPHRIVDDIARERRLSVESVLEMRRSNQPYNDAKGYDTITVPATPTREAFISRVFTKEEYRIDRSGDVLPRPVRGWKKKKGADEGGGEGRGGGGKNKKGRKAKSSSTLGSNQKRVTDFFREERLS